MQEQLGILEINKATAWLPECKRVCACMCVRVCARKAGEWRRLNPHCRVVCLSDAWCGLC